MEQIGVVETLMLREFSKIIFNIGDNKMNMENFIREFKIYCENVEDTEVLVLAYADKYEIDLSNYLDNICNLVDKYVFELYF